MAIISTLPRITRAGLALLLLIAGGRAAAQATELEGLWYSKRYFGPEVQGRLEILRSGDRWRATIGARRSDVRVSGDSVTFDLPSAARFAGRFARDRRSIAGQWIEPARRIAMPVVLSPCGGNASDCFAVDVRPVEDEFTFYMEVRRRADGKLGAFLRNPERNQGKFIQLDHLERRGDTVHFRTATGDVLATGLLRMGALSVPLRFATHDFRPVPRDSFTFYYPRGRPTASYAYDPPLAKNDGWRVGRARDVGLSEGKLTDMVRAFVNASRDTAELYRPHGFLIARNGTLVLEEYFLGEHGDKPHDTRSASKTVVTVTLGAAMHAGMKVGPDMPVYASLGLAPASLEPRKRAMTVRHLLTMSSGLDCDDSAPDADRYPGTENVITNQDNPNWLGMVLGLKLLRDPGAQAVYCSINPFLAGEVIARATGRSFPDLAWELVAAPLQMGRHSLTLTPLGESYMGGGARYVLRDFAKFAQLYANGGTWNGKRILTEAWVKESIEPRYRIGRTFRNGPNGRVEAPTNNYGYLWWSTEFEHQGRVVRAYHASGNGGQYSMFIPELDLVIATFSGNYADAGGFYALRELVPKFILPALVR